VCVDRAPARARERRRTRKYLDSGYVHVYEHEHEHVHVQGAIFYSSRYSPGNCDISGEFMGGLGEGGALL
jgi:hypothetical protein